MNLPPLPPLPKLPPLPPLPVLQLPFPFEPEYSPWFPMSRFPWEPGEYQLKALVDGVEQVLSGKYLFTSGRVWNLGPYDPAVVFLGWRGLARPSA